MYFENFNEKLALFKRKKDFKYILKYPRNFEGTQIHLYASVYTRVARMAFSMQNITNLAFLE